MATHGPGQPFNGTGPGSFEDGMWDYKFLPLPHASVQEDPHLGASWSFEPSNGRFISYDTPGIAVRKAHYINQRGLGGAMYWELSGDKVGNECIVGAVASQLHGGLLYKENELSYPSSCECRTRLCLARWGVLLNPRL